MIKVLIVSTIGLKYEGTTSVIYNYISSMNKDNLQFDFIAFEDINPKIKKSFEQLGNVLTIPKRKNNTGSYVRALNNILKSHYDVIHIHGNSGTMAIETILSKLHTTKKIIIHCHNTTCNHPVLNKLLVPVIKHTADVCIGCSEAAAHWLYGNSKYVVLNNAIDLSKFKYNEEIRKSCRLEFGFNNEFVIGHVGRFDKQKNHTFLIDIFSELHKRKSDTKLLLVSDGPEIEKIRRKVFLLGLEEAVIFVGRRSDMDRLYQAMDFFLLPSLWEGLPVVMIEAQASGLPLLVSDKITQEAKCTKKTEYLSLDYDAGRWAEKILEIREKNYLRDDKVEGEIRQHGFDIKTETNKLRRIYLGSEIKTMV